MIYTIGLVEGTFLQDFFTSSFYMEKTERVDGVRAAVQYLRSKGKEIYVAFVQEES